MFKLLIGLVFQIFSDDVKARFPCRHGKQQCDHRIGMDRGLHMLGDGVKTRACFHRLFGDLQGNLSGYM